MRIINEKLYLEFSELVECGVSENTLKKASTRNSNCWNLIDDPTDKRKVLISYEDLKPVYKDAVQKRFGNPYDLISRTPILDSIQIRPEAYDFFFSYKHESGRLPPKVVAKYTRMDAYLHKLGTLSLGDIKRGFGLTVPQYYQHVAELIKTEVIRGKDKDYIGAFQLPGDFPSSYQRLKTKAENYKKQSFVDLIDPMFGNKKSSKIGKYEGGFCPEIEAQQMAVIRTVAAKHNNLDAGQVAGLVNVLFEQNGWESITRRRILQIMEENKMHLTPGRRGRRSFQSDVAMQVKRSAPKFPTYYFTLDGWTVEMLYQNKDSYDNRLVVVIVLDAMNKYPVGYAIGDRENCDLIREANRNALLHLRDLFGDYYRPNQLQSDNYGIKQLTPFYQAASHLHTPAAVGNAKSKIIEPYFRYLNKKYCQVQPNWSGHNIDSRKENQVNREFLDLIKKDFPDRDGVVKKIEQFIAIERASKIEKYLEKWAEMPPEHKQKLSASDWLEVFGIPMGKTNTITGQGIIKTIDGVSHTYDTFDPDFRRNMHIDWQLKIDPQDFSRALAVSPDNKLRFLLEEKMSIPMDIISTNDEHRDHLKKIKDYNKDRIAEITKQYAEDAEIVQEIINKRPLQLDDTEEAALKLMFTYGGQQKERIQDAKGLKQLQAQQEKEDAKEQKQESKEWQQKREEYMKSKIDLNQYLD